MSLGSGAALTDQQRWSWWIMAEQAMTCAQVDTSQAARLAQGLAAVIRAAT